MRGIDTVVRQRGIQAVAEIASAVIPGNVEIDIRCAIPLADPAIV
jgi:hypothetical protein